MWSTVVPALDDPRRERPPDVYGHVTNVPTHLNVKLPAIGGGHLPNAYTDSHLLVVHTCYNGQCKQMPRFWWSFQPKITYPNLRPTVRSNFHATIWWPQAIFHIKKKCLRDEPRDWGKSGPLVTFVLRHHVVKVSSSVLNMRCRSFDQCASCRALDIELVWQNANSTYRGKQSDHRGRVVSGGRPDMKYVERLKSWLTLTTSIRVLFFLLLLLAVLTPSTCGVLCTVSVWRGVCGYLNILVVVIAKFRS